MVLIQHVKHSIWTKWTLSITGCYFCFNFYALQSSGSLFPALYFAIYASCWSGITLRFFELRYIYHQITTFLLSVEVSVYETIWQIIPRTSYDKYHYPDSLTLTDLNYTDLYIGVRYSNFEANLIKAQQPQYSGLLLLWKTLHTVAAFCQTFTDKNKFTSTSSNTTSKKLSLIQSKVFDVLK